MSKGPHHFKLTRNVVLGEGLLARLLALISLGVVHTVLVHVVLLSGLYFPDLAWNLLHIDNSTFNQITSVWSQTSYTWMSSFCRLEMPLPHYLSSQNVPIGPTVEESSISDSIEPVLKACEMDEPLMLSRRLLRFTVVGNHLMLISHHVDV